MSCSIDRLGSGRPAAAGVWTLTGVWALLVGLASLAVGFWPGAIDPNGSGQPVRLHALASMAVGQGLLVALIWPLASAAAPLRRREAVGQLAMLLAVSAPALALAAYVSDASVRDVARVLVAVVLLWPAAWLTRRWLIGRRGDVALLVAVVALLGLPAGYYVFREWYAPAPMGPARWLWWAGPLTFLWETADQRRGSWLPHPLWPSLVWPGVAILVRLLEELARPTPENSSPRK